MGFVVTSSISLSVFSREVRSTKPVSGLPFAAESVRLLSQIPSNSLVEVLVVTVVFSIINAVSPLWASIIRVDHDTKMRIERGITGGFLPKQIRAYLGMGQSAFICVLASDGLWTGVSVRTETLWGELVGGLDDVNDKRRGYVSVWLGVFRTGLIGGAG